MNANEQVTVGEAAMLVATAKLEERHAVESYDASGEERDLELASRARLRRERAERVHASAMARAGEEQRAEDAARRAEDVARLRELVETLTPEAFARDARPTIEAVAALDRDLAERVDELRALVGERRDRFREAAAIAERIGESHAFRCREIDLDDARLLCAIVVARAREAEGREGTPCEAFISPEHRPPFTDPERPRYDAAASTLPALGTALHTEEGLDA